MTDSTSPGYYSRLFVVPKPDGSFRPVIDLKKLNQFIIVLSFKMETLFSIIAALQPQEWITKIDLKDAYHHILVHVNIRKYFRFVVAGIVYQFHVLPFGLSAAPREFTKTLAPVVQLLRSQGIQVHAYLDHTCKFSRTESRTYTTHYSTSTIIGLDNQLGQINVTTITNPGLSGFTFQPGTSPYFPSGLVLSNSHQCPIPSISVDGHDCSKSFIHHQQDVTFCPIHIQQPSSPSVSTVLVQSPVVSTSAVVGYTNSVGYGLPHIPALVSKANSDDRRSVTSSGTQPVLLHGCISQGMGRQLDGQSDFRTKVSSRITTSYKWLELEAIRLALLQWGHQWRHQSVRVYCDNSTAAAYIRKQGGTRSQSLFHKTLELFDLLDQCVITLVPTHLPGARNVTADALSQISQPSPTEWRLPTETLNNLFCAFGTPLIDMFATAENRVMPVYVSPYPDDRAWAVDALSLSWDDLGLVYAFPPAPICSRKAVKLNHSLTPAPIVPKTLQRIHKSRGTTVIMIASQHPSRPWHPLLLQLSTRPRIPPQNVNLFQYVPNLRRPQYHRDPRLLDLAAWNLSGTS